MYQLGRVTATLATWEEVELTCKRVYETVREIDRQTDNSSERKGKAYHSYTIVAAAAPPKSQCHRSNISRGAQKEVLCALPSPLRSPV